MEIKNYLIYGTYSLLIILYALSIRLFSYGIGINDILVKDQIINISGLILLFALALSFNILLIKGIFEVNKAETEAKNNSSNRMI